jgi:hypothetical protein
VAIRDSINNALDRATSREVLGQCPACKRNVHGHHPHVRYRGKVWHAVACLDGAPRSAQRLANRMEVK